MKLMIMGILLSLVSFSASAQRYSCDLVGGVDEYTIYVGLDVKKACFFDNDSCGEIDLVDIKYYETYPLQTVYIFAGETRANGKVEIYFNLTKLSASVTEYIGTSSESTMEAQVKCRLDSRIVFDD